MVISNGAGGEKMILYYIRGNRLNRSGEVVAGWTDPEFWTLYRDDGGTESFYIADYPTREKAEAMLAQFQSLKVQA